MPISHIFWSYPSKNEMKTNNKLSHTIINVNLLNLHFKFWGLKNTNEATYHVTLLIILNCLFFNTLFVDLEITKKVKRTSETIIIKVILGKRILMSFWKKSFAMERQYGIASKISWWAMQLHLLLKIICVSPTYKAVSNKCTREVYYIYYI
jgi:hypothetical protein